MLDRIERRGSGAPRPALPTVRRSECVGRTGLGLRLEQMAQARRELALGEHGLARHWLERASDEFSAMDMRWHRAEAASHMCALSPV